MVCLILLVGHLWTCSGCLRPPYSGSAYIEVSVSMTAMHTVLHLLAHMDVVTVMRQTRTSYYKGAVWGHESACTAAQLGLCTAVASDRE